MALLESVEWENRNQLSFSPVNEELVQAGVDEVDNQGTVVTTNLHVHRGKDINTFHPTSLTPSCLETKHG